MNMLSPDGSDLSNLIVITNTTLHIGLIVDHFNWIDLKLEIEYSTTQLVLKMVVDHMLDHIQQMFLTNSNYNNLFSIKIEYLNGISSINHSPELDLK